MMTPHPTHTSSISILQFRISYKQQLSWFRLQWCCVVPLTITHHPNNPIDSIHYIDNIWLSITFYIHHHEQSILCSAVDNEYYSYKLLSITIIQETITLSETDIITEHFENHHQPSNTIWCFLWVTVHCWYKKDEKDLENVESWVGCLRFGEHWIKFIYLMNINGQAPLQDYKNAFGH